MGQNKAERPLDVAQIDHTPADAILVDSFERNPNGRPRMILAIDIVTCVATGYHASFEAPSRLARCLTRAVAPEAGFLAELECAVPWPAQGNARFFEGLIQHRVVDGDALRHVILMCLAVNDADYSALESLEAINPAHGSGVGLHLLEMKGPVMGRLKTTHFLDQLNERVFLSQYDAWKALAKPVDPAKVAE